jgi:ribonuclease J
LSEHARIATESGIAAAVAPNGTMLDLSGDVPEVAEHVETGRLYLDGTALIGALDGVVRDRIRMALNGLATVTVILDETDTPMGEPWVELMGLPPIGRGERPLSETMEADLDEVIGRLGRKVMADDTKLEEEIRKVVRQVAMEEIGKKPEVTVVISRLVAE